MFPQRPRFLETQPELGFKVLQWGQGLGIFALGSARPKSSTGEQEMPRALGSWVVSQTTDHWEDLCPLH